MERREACEVYTYQSTGICAVDAIESDRWFGVLRYCGRGVGMGVQRSSSLNEWRADGRRARCDPVSLSRKHGGDAVVGNGWEGER